MTKRFKMVVTLMVAASFVPVVAAQGPAQGPRPGGRRPAFTELDKNSDGKVTRDEWQGPADLFGRVDTNGDGSVVAAEWNAAPPPGGRRGGPPLGGRVLEALDANQDGGLSQSEFGQAVSFFDKLDQDKDGALTAAELDGFPHAIGGGPAGPGARGPRPSFTDLDTNSDKKVSRDEWKGPAEAFDRIDANDDGFIDEAELAGAKGPGPRGGASPLSARLLGLLDGNADSKVSRDEFARLAGLFSSLDADQNGLLSPREIEGLFRPAGEGSR